MDTEQNAILELTDLEVEDDPEAAHINAEEILLEAIRELGYTKLADTYERISQGFWYA